jgi:hypothetical protein
MLSLIALAATAGGYPQSCQVSSSYGYAQQQYVATPYVAQAYGTGYAPTYQNKVVTAFVPVYQYDQYRVELVGDQARAQQYASQRLQADTNLIQAITGMAKTLDTFRAQVADATKVQDQAFRQQAQAPPPPDVRPSPQQPYPSSQQPSPPFLSAPSKSPPVPSKNPPGDVSSGDSGSVPPPPDDPGTFPVQPQQPQGFQSSAPDGPLSPTMQSATAIIGARCGSCHGPNGSGGFQIMASKDRLASYALDFLKMLDQVAYRGYVLKPDGTKLKMPPGGRGLTADQYASVHAASDEAEQAATLASNAGGGR